jgi:hypothetical protein
LEEEPLDAVEGGREDGEALPSFSFPWIEPKTEDIVGRIFARLELVGMVNLNAAVILLGVDGRVGGTWY